MKKFIACLLLMIVVAGAVGVERVGTIGNGKQSLKKNVEVKQVTLEDRIEDYLDQNLISKDQISIYVQDLDGEERYMLNEGIDFFAASIYKVPLAMLYYDKIANKELLLSDKLYYDASYYEAGGPIATNIQAGTYLSVEMLLENLIVYSDNTAGHILFEQMGGWGVFKQLCETYHHTTSDSINYQNEMNASYMNDVMQYLYENQNRYQMLLDDMKASMPNDYLNKNVHGITIQKYGSYGSANNAVGIVLEGHPYSIVVFTDLEEAGISVIGDLNALCYEYFNSK